MRLVKFIASANCALKFKNSKKLNDNFISEN